VGGTAERDKSIPKTTCVKTDRTLDAVSDGTLAGTRMNAQGSAADHHLSCTEQSMRSRF
jgi:hypothetical protein